MRNLAKVGIILIVVGLGVISLWVSIQTPKVQTQERASLIENISTEELVFKMGTYLEREPVILMKMTEVNSNRINRIPSKK